MKCRHVKKLISPYIDGELSAADTKQFTMHIEACAACRQELEEMKGLSRMFASVERTAAPYGFATRVLAGAEANERHRNRLAHILRPFFVRAAEGAFACIVVFIGVISGGMLITDRTATLNTEEIKSAFHLDVFESAPPDSVAGVYIAMTEVHNEK
jgi:anti-sigma factor RsiW